MDAAGTTYVCTMTNQWVKTKPLIGVRPLSGPCQGDPGYCRFFVSIEDEIIEAFGEKPAARLRKRYRDRGELTSNAMRRLVFSAQRRKERQHFRDRKLLMNYEKQRAEMRKNMGLNAVLGGVKAPREPTASASSGA